MKIKQKALINALLGFASLISVAFLWQRPILLLLVMLTLTALIMKLRVNNSFITIYFIGFLFGPIAEVIAIHYGAWKYAESASAGIPVWLPFLWGNAALFIVNTYLLLAQPLKKK